MPCASRVFFRPSQSRRRQDLRELLIAQAVENLVSRHGILRANDRLALRLGDLHVSDDDHHGNQNDDDEVDQEFDHAEIPVLLVE